MCSSSAGSERADLTPPPGRYYFGVPGMVVEVPLRRVDKYTWMIPAGSQPCMKVPSIIYADDFLIKKMREDLTLRQAMNVACLKGIQKYSIVMPDGHQGYGFPIGGVAAMAIDEDGVISPGGVGYDINCLSPDTRILTEYGYTVRIKDLASVAARQAIVARGESGAEPARIRFIAVRSLEPGEKAVRLVTESGWVVEGSRDHPVLTRDGFKRLDQVRPGDEVVVYPFDGVEYEDSNDVIVDEKTLSDIPHEALAHLKRLGLIPLRYNDPRAGVLARLLGFALGDGHLGTMGGRLVLSFYGRPDVLENVKRDIERLGLSASLYVRKRGYSIRTASGEYSGESETAELRVSSRAFAHLMKALGMPLGKKVETPYRVPEWIMRAPRWIKRNFLAGLFGADGSIPSFKGKTPLPIHLTQSKASELADSLELFLDDVKTLLRELGIGEVLVYPVKTAVEGRVTLRLAVEGEEDISRFLGVIGYEYDDRKRVRGLYAHAYLRLKRAIKLARANAARVAGEVYNATGSIRLAHQAVSQLVNRRFVERAVYQGISEARLPQGFPDFEDYVKAKAAGGGFVYDRVVKVEEYDPDYREFYDIGVYHKAHNFIANGIVVHNCGVRVLRTDLTIKDVRPRIKELVDTIYYNVPSGLGSTGKVRVTVGELERVLAEGVQWAVQRGYAWADDPEHIEERGSWSLADPSKVSARAKQRGAAQLGTLGSGNHFLEVQVVDRIFDERIAKAFGIEEEGQVVVMIHTGSRGLGHQVASDYLAIMERAMRKYGIRPPDRELASVPYSTREAQDYIRAMASAANFAWTNRQLITYWTRESFRKVFHRDPDQLGMRIVYDVAHNIAKFEEYDVDGKRRKLIIHRKGATRAFPPGHPEIPKDYKDYGQPVLIPGSMGTASYILAGTVEGVKSWYTAPHGAGRWMSRARAKRTKSYTEVVRELEVKGIYLRASNRATVVEEMPEAYKDVDRVAQVAHAVGIGRLVARLRPIGVTKG